MFFPVNLELVSSEHTTKCVLNMLSILSDALKQMLENEMEKREEHKEVSLKEYLDGLEVVRNAITLF